MAKMKFKKGGKWQGFLLAELNRLLFGEVAQQKSLAQVCATICSKTGWPAPRHIKPDMWSYAVKYGVEVCNIDGFSLQQKPAKEKTTKRKSFKQFQAFYTDKPWRSLRYEALKIHGAKCQCCGGTPASTGKPMHVDHIKPRSKFPELELELSNLQVLCEDCNMGKGGRDQTDWRQSLSSTA